MPHLRSTYARTGDAVAGSCPPVVVGIDGSPGTEGAVRAAVADARRLDAPLHLVHVVPDRFALAAVDALVGADLVGRGASVLAPAAAAVARTAPDLEIGTELRRGTVAGELAGAGETAAAVYIGRGSPSSIGVLAGRAGTATAGRAPCPVVSVPATWWPGRSRGGVVVALKSAAGAPELFADAFAEADSRGDRLVVVHSWRLPDVYDDIVTARVGRTEPGRRAAAALEVLLEEWRTSYPAVEVELRVVHDHPAAALVEASADADLLVLVRRTHGLGGAGILGGTARAVLRDARCPVRVLPTEGMTAVPGLVVEQAGDLVR
ncbi:universal stress protein [Nocardioides marmotae]|uniref:UspA domain-containing protein n=1 Tax=Nocardioides marmotae TaxID=2663857 RepID=A0A6I3J464_9ACTN|nr:universal stress protein [Nocardioides marmotae]MCR6030063.1 hypothetical protein [Gordonia jinghuaiqii]MBC9733020.1 universal stress protein [Nocardioides marmotae]MTB84134.1 hypothetical protein [Nocardioides marmotae]MTB93694.1 hypothetical protein [Nocardioides marmotae]QKE00041.1 universal stress protein [Nocardioides marmotae]